MNKSEFLVLVFLCLIFGLIIGFVISNTWLKPQVEISTQCSINPIKLNRILQQQQAISFTVIPPDNDYCPQRNVILSLGNFTRLQNNVGVFTIPKDSKVYLTTSPNMSYCQLAKWLYDAHTDTYPQTQERFKKYMLPDWCEPELNPINSTNYKVVLNDTVTFNDTADVNNTADIPEFGSMILLILVFSIVGIIALQSKYSLFMRKW